MGILSVYVVNKAGGLIFWYDHQASASAEVEAIFSYPLAMVLEEVDRNIVVKFGEPKKCGIQGVCVRRTGSVLC